MLHFNRRELGEVSNIKQTQQRLVFCLIRANLCFEEPTRRPGCRDQTRQSQPSLARRHLGPFRPSNYLPEAPLQEALEDVAELLHWDSVLTK